MNKPDDVSQDAWERACAATDSPFPTDIEAIARAIDAATAAEREACAHVADEHAKNWSGTRNLDMAVEEATKDEHAESIATAIRNRGASK